MADGISKTGKIVDYTLVNGASDTELMQVVNTMLRQGWEPVGGPVSVQDQTQTGKFIQALIKRG